MKFALLVHNQVLGSVSNVFAHDTQRNQLSWGFYGDILLWEMCVSVCEISFSACCFMSRIKNQLITILCHFRTISSNYCGYKLTAWTFFLFVVLKFVPRTL